MAVLALVVPLLAACGSSDEHSEGEATSAATMVTSSAAPSTEPAATVDMAPGPPLPDGATVEQIAAASKSVLGPTDDVAGSLRPFIDVPVAVPTPLGADITYFSVSMTSIDPSPQSFSVMVVLDASGSPADLVTFYEAELAAAGHSRTGGGRKGVFGRADLVQFVEFEVAKPTNDSGVATTTIEVQVAEADSTASVTVFLNGRTAARPELIRRLGAWPGEIPGLERAELTSVAILSPLSGVDGRLPGISLDAGYDVPEASVALLEPAIVAALPSSMYALAKHDREGHALTLERDGFDEVTLSLRDSSGLDVESGETYEEVDVYVAGWISFDGPLVGHS